MIRIAFTGGGSGGHIFPIIAVARKLREIEKTEGKEIEFIYIGETGAYEELLKKEGFRVLKIAASKLRRYFDIENFIDFLKFPIGVFQAFLHLFTYMPDILFSKGGPGSFQVVSAAWLLRIPIIIHESDSVPGKANLLSSKFANRIGVAFAGAKQYFPEKITALTGNPTRIDSTDYTLAKEELEKLDLNPQKPYILILGGSQGAEKINSIVLATLPQLLKFTQVIHQTGAAHEKALKALAVEIISGIQGYKIFGFIEEPLLYKLLSGAQIIISRAGAGSIFEIAAFGKPSILIPIEESANDHQRRNAQEYSVAGACKIIEEPNLTPNLFMSVVKHIIEDQKIREAMQKSALAFAKPQAAEIIAKEIMLFARE